VKENMTEKKEGVGFSDRVIAILRDKNGKVNVKYDSAEHEHHCLTNTGFAQIAGLLLLDVGGTAFDYIGIGTGTTGAAATDTTLGVEKKRKAGTGTRITTTVTNDTAKLVATFSSADGLSGTDQITEVGEFNAASSGVMDMRQTFTAIPCNWDGGDSLEMTVTIQAKQGA
jgi:hypothetical protein